MRRPAYMPPVEGFDEDEALAESDPTAALDSLPANPFAEAQVRGAPSRLKEGDGDAMSALDENDKADLDAAVGAKLASQPPPPPPGSLMPELQGDARNPPPPGGPPPMPKAMPAGYDDEQEDKRGIQKAMERDEQNRILRALELAGRQLVSGVLQQPMAESVNQPTNYEEKAIAAAARNKAERNSRADKERSFESTEEQRRLAAAHQRWLEKKAAEEAERRRNRDEKADAEKDEDQDIRRQQNKAMLELTRLGLKDKKEVRNEKEEADDEESARKLAAAIGGNPASIARQLERIRGVVDRNPGDIPGVGTLDSLTPEALLSDDGQSVRADAKALVNTLLSIKSGAGVSDKERETNYQLYGIGKGSSEQAFRAGMEKLQKDIASEVRAKEAGFKPKVVERYRSRGGITPEQIDAPSSGGDSNDMVTVIRKSDGETRRMTRAQAAKAGPKYEVR